MAKEPGLGPESNHPVHQAVDPKNLPQDRISTTDASGKRMYVYPADVSGRWARRKQVVQWGLLLLFLAAPWIRVGGQPLILLDVAHRQFTLFGVRFWAHDAPMVLFFLGGGAFFLAFATSVWGRVWCGWACPQTVFIERVYRRLERWIEGDFIARRKRDTGSFTLDYFWRKVLKWSAFLGVSLVVTHSFLAYFVGSSEVLQMMARSPGENLNSFLVICVTTAIILFDFGWFREQFCLIACPYGRMQAVMMDQRSMVVAYDSARGEPRGKANSSTAAGDCVDCYRCVQVCPTGIDIRRGLQLECIACTACMDACDDVMGRLHRPLGLIRYSTVAEIATPLAQRVEQMKKIGVSLLRPRPLLYGGVFLILLGGLVGVLQMRKPVDLVWVRAVGLPYEESGPVGVLNRFHVDITNQGFVPLTLRFSVAPETQVKLIRAQEEQSIAEGASRRLHLFFEFPRSILSHGKRVLSVQIRAQGPDGTLIDERTEEVKLVGPF